MATESDNVNSGALGTLLAVGAFATLGIGLVVTALVRSETVEEMQKKEVEADRPFRDLMSEQTAKLAAPAAYVDRGRGLVSLPIDRAMELTVSGLKKDPNSATPPPPVGGTGGMGGMGGMGGVGGAATSETGGTAAEMGGTGGLAPGAENKPDEEAKPGEEKKDEKDEKKPDVKKDGAKPKLVAPVPASPVPAAPAPAAPAPAAPAAPAPAAPVPHGQ